jgi:hypothetical protein
LRTTGKLGMQRKSTRQMRVFYVCGHWVTAIAAYVRLILLFWMEHF